MSWTAPEIDRADPPRLGDERSCLQGWLDFQRDTLLMKCAGLTHELLARRSTPPSELSLLGLVRHMADVERWWFRANLLGEDVDGFFGPADNLTGDFDDLDSMPAEEVWRVYSRERADADSAAAGIPLGRTFRSRNRGTELDLRWIYLHMIEEYARHNGHADLLRERIDGTVGD